MPKRSFKETLQIALVLYLRAFHDTLTVIVYCLFVCLQCFDAVGLGGRKGIRPAKTSDMVLAWLPVWSEVQTCIWHSWCHCHSLSSCFSKIQIGFTFLVQAQGVFPDKGPLNGCVCVCLLAWAATEAAFSATFLENWRWWDPGHTVHVLCCMIMWRIRCQRWGVRTTIDQRWWGRCHQTTTATQTIWKKSRIVTVQIAGPDQ